MHNTSLIEILRTFSHEELKKFDDFLNSPYHNKKTAVINLYKQIKKYAPEFESARLKKEKLWNGLYPDKRFSYGVFKNLIYDLTHLAEKFIKLEYHSNDFLHPRYELLDSLFERQIKNLFNSKFKSVKDEIENFYFDKKVDAGNYHYYMARIYLLKWSFSRLYEKSNLNFDDFQMHSVFQASSILNMIFHTSINAMTFSKDYSYDKEQNGLLSFAKNCEFNELIAGLIDSIKPISSEVYTNLHAYHKYFRTVSDPSSVAKYLEFKETLSMYANSFSNEDRYILYSGLRNALKSLVSYEVNKSKEVLDIIQLKIKDEVLLNPDRFLDMTEFRACIEAASDMGESKFISDFTKRFIDYIPADARDNMQKYSQAHFYFTESEFEKSLETLLTINCDSLVMKYYLKNLQLMNYYELNDYDSFTLAMDAYKHFLDKNKSITSEWKTGQKLFCNFLCKLFKLKQNFSHFELKNLKKTISESLVSKKQWLLSKVKEF